MMLLLLSSSLTEIGAWSSSSSAAGCSCAVDVDGATLSLSLASTIGAVAVDAAAAATASVAQAKAALADESSFDDDVVLGVSGERQGPVAAMVKVDGKQKQKM